MRRRERGREDGNTVDRQGVRSRQGRIRGPDRFRQRFQGGMRQEIGLKRYIGAKTWRASNAKFRTSDFMRGAEVGRCLGGQRREWMEGEGSRKKRLSASDFRGVLGGVSDPDHDPSVRKRAWM